METKTKPNGRKQVLDAMAADQVAAPTGADIREEVKILPLERARIKLRVRGTTPLVMNNWSEKSLKMMEDKQGGECVTKGAKRPKDCYEAAFYFIATKKGQPKRYGFPAVAFKCAMVSACSFVDGVTKVLARGALFVIAQVAGMVEINGTLTDHGGTFNRMPVRNASGVADLRYRPMFDAGWTADLEIEFDPSNLKPGQVVNMLNRGGFHIGIGEGRPEKRDMGWGRFEVVEQL